jgi:chloride channel protein, CIC family
VVLAPAEESVEIFLSKPGPRRIRHVVITEADRIIGVLRVNTALRHVSASAQASVTMRDIASPNFVIVQEDEILFDVIQDAWSRDAFMTVVVRAGSAGGASDVVGIISKEHVADSVAASVAAYAD